MPPTESTQGGSLARSSTPADRRKALGAWYTPAHLVDMVVERTITADWVAAHMCRGRHRPIRVLDPACGDGRFLAAAGRLIVSHGGTVELTGTDVDPAALDLVDAAIDGDVEVLCCDALTHEWGNRRFDLVVGNPPFLSQLAAGTTRGGASRHGGGPYADAAAEFLALALDLAEPDRGRIALVLPQSLLASRDAAPVRAVADRRSAHLWAWWSPQRHFDADVLVCAIGLERHADAGHPPAGSAPCPPGSNEWTHVVIDELGIPRLADDLVIDGLVGDRADLNANFRDEYYGLVPAVFDDPSGHSTAPPLITSGLIDPGRCHWGGRRIRFAKRVFDAPRVDVERLDDRMRAWATRKLVPKVLVAAQTTVIEAVADPSGGWLPGVPVVSIVPRSPTTVDEIAAVLTSPIATVVAWWRAAGTGLSATSLRLGPGLLAGIPWPAGELGPAIDALRAGDVDGCGRAVAAAYGAAPDDPAISWWATRVPAGPAAAGP